MIAEVEAAGGLRHWLPGGIDSCDQERVLLEQIKLAVFDADDFPAIYLGYGNEDRYRGASIMLAEHLPQDQVSVMSGGHDWDTWVRLWGELLDRSSALHR